MAQKITPELLTPSQLDWNEKSIKDEPLRQYLLSIVDFSNKLHNYYKKRIRRKRWASHILGTLSVIFFTLTLLIPVMVEEEVELCTRKISEYELAYASAILASTIMLINRLFGHTESYKRYITTFYRINGLVSKYNGIWIQNLNDYDLDNLTPDDVDKLIEVLLTFDDSVRAVVESETEEWKTIMTAEWNAFRNSVDSKASEYTKKLVEKRKEEKEQKKQQEDELKKQEEIAHINFAFEKKPAGHVVKITLSGKTTKGEDKTFQKTSTLLQTSLTLSGIPQGTYHMNCELMKDDQLAENISKTIAITSGGVSNETLKFGT